MNTEKHILGLIQEGNPIPDPAELSIDSARSQIYLDAINRRNKENTMSGMDTPPEAPQKPWTRFLIPVAVVLALVIGGWALFSETEGEIDPAAPPTTLPVTPTTLPARSTTTSVEALAPVVIGYWEGPGVQIQINEAEYLIVRDEALVDVGTYTSEPDTITLTAGSETVKCTQGDEGTHDYVLSDDGTMLSLTVGPDDCGHLRGLGLRTLELTRTVQFALPEEIPPGLHGYEIFNGQSEPGVYENDPSRFRSVIFTMDGSWSCVHTVTHRLGDDWPICGSHGPVFELDGATPASTLLVADAPGTPEEVLTSLRSNDEVIVGTESEFVPSGTDEWTAIMFTLDPVDSVPNRSSHCGLTSTPCPLTDLIQAFDTEAVHSGPQPTSWVVSARQTIWLITHNDGSEFMAIAWFSPGYIPPVEDILAHTEAATKVVDSLQFP